MIDLRSDTVTKPTAAMRKAMLQAEVGDDVYAEDPTINRLQEEAAQVVGTEAALFVCSGTMGNLIAVLAHCSARGSEVIIGDQSHVYQYEGAGMSVLGGVAFNVLANTEDGRLPLDAVEAAIRPADQHAAVTTCICIENTHNRCGGAVLPLAYMQSLHSLARSKGLVVHLDGARVFNAATALGVPVSHITAHVDSVQFCLSKGLGAPVGSILAGSKAFIAKAHKLRKMLGGGQRQAGVVAAPGLIALNDMSKRLGDDHQNAQLLAQGVAAMPHASIDVNRVQSNILIFKVKAPFTAIGVAAALKARGVLAHPFMGGIRMVTHADVSSDDCQQAVQVLREILAEPETASNGANGHHANGHAYAPYSK